jgi:carbamoyl-phosphate synthase large subunit
VRIANDKWATVRALIAHGVPVPSSYCGESKEELLESVSFPILSKPRFGRGGRGIVIHRSSSDLPESLSTDRIYQEFLPGKEYDVNLFADPGGTNPTSVVLRKTALKDGLVGNALTVERDNDREVSELAEAAVAALSLEGPIDIDIRRGVDGRAFILEINARVGANVRAAEEILIAMITSWRDKQ